MTSTNQILVPVPAVFPAPFFAPTPETAKSMRDFFTTQIEDDHTCKAYMNATCRFAVWCKARSIAELGALEYYPASPAPRPGLKPWTSPSCSKNIVTIFKFGVSQEVRQTEIKHWIHKLARPKDFSAPRQRVRPR